MHVLVLGDSGMLGHALCHRLRHAGMAVSVLDRAGFDARNPDFALVRAAGVDAVVNAIGMVNRRLDRPEAEFLRVNSLFPRRLADCCESLEIPLIHVSTDCVFKGDVGLYDEASPALAADLYGCSKLWGEPGNALVLRTSIIGPELRNYYSLLCWFLAQKGRVRGFVNHRWNGVTTYELGRAIAAILEDGLYQPGVRHVYGEDLTKFELLRLIRSAYEVTNEIDPCDDESARDTRLRTIYPDFLSKLGISPMAEQLVRLRSLSDARGYWTAD